MVDSFWRRFGHTDIMANKHNECSLLTEVKYVKDVTLTVMQKASLIPCSRRLSQPHENHCRIYSYKRISNEVCSNVCDGKSRFSKQLMLL